VQSQKRHRTSLCFAHPLARNARPDWAGRPICHFLAAYGLRPPRLTAWGESPQRSAPRATAFCPSPERVGSARCAHLKTQLPEALASLTSGTHGGASLRSFPPTNRSALGRLNPLGRILDKWLPPSSNVSAGALPFSDASGKTKGLWSSSFAELPLPFLCPRPVLDFAGRSACFRKLLLPAKVGTAPTALLPTPPAFAMEVFATFGAECGENGGVGLGNFGRYCDALLPQKVTLLFPVTLARSGPIVTSLLDRVTCESNAVPDRYYLE